MFVINEDAYVDGMPTPPGIGNGEWVYGVRKLTGYVGPAWLERIPARLLICDDIDYREPRR